jgi:regulatory protein
MTPSNPKTASISAIEPGKRRKRFNVYIDGVFAVAAGEKVIADLGLRVGQEIDVERLQQITLAEEARRAVESAGRLLETRARSSREIEQRLTQKGFEDAVIQTAIATLRRLGLVDDSDFATQWIESRSRSRPKGARALRAELTQKGVDRERIDQALGAISADDEMALARNAVLSKIGRGGIPPDGPSRTAEYRRLAAFLQRRGFTWETVKTVLAEQFGAIDDD